MIFKSRRYRFCWCRFLGDWQGGGFDAGYAQGRIPKNGMMFKHIQIESNMSLAGANADVRIPMTVAQQKQALADLYYAVVNGAQPKMLK